MGLLVMAAVADELGALDGEAVGVGPVMAAANAARILAARAPSAVVLLGTAGAYPGTGPALGAVVASSRVGLSRGVADVGLGYAPLAPQPLDADPGLLARLDLPQHGVLTVNAITTDPALARQLADGYTVEHMEAYGVAVACAHAKIPFVAILGITNQVGPDAHAQWLAHRDPVQAAVRAALTALRS